MFNKDDIDSIVYRYKTLNHSARMIAEDFNVHHGTITRALRKAGIEPLKRTESAKYTWQNHTHPNTGKKGSLSHQFGKKLSEETKEKIRQANTAENNYHWSGGRKLHSQGYVLIYKPEHPYADASGFVFEHRYVMEQFIGRYLKTNEIVHHVDENRQNNHINNLAVMDVSAHARLHHLERKAATA